MEPSDQLLRFAQRVAVAERKAVAEALNRVEDRRPEAQAGVEALLSVLKERPGTLRVGLTGPPGVGKSSLTGALARELRRRGRSVGVLAVDPSSMRSGGALLGDSARMAFDPTDTGVFVRSLATGGETGGLAYAAHAAADVLSAAYDVVLVETTGVGQTETDVEHLAETVCLVIQPGSGDSLQFIKSGIMEIPDILVVNKADHGKLAQRARLEVDEARASMREAQVAPERAYRWQVPVLMTSAAEGTGIAALVDAFDAHHQALGGEGRRLRRHNGEAHWTEQLLRRRYGEHCIERLGGHVGVRTQVLAALARGAVPVAIAGELSERYLAALRKD